MDSSDLQRAVHAAWSELLGERTFGPDDNFFDVGGHSLLLVRLQAALRRATGTKPAIADLLRHGTVRSQTRLLGGEDAPPRPAAATTVQSRTGDDDAIAVVGMAARFAGAADLPSFWDNLRTGRDCFSEGPGPVITHLPDGQRRVARWGMAAEGARYDADLLGFGPDDLRDGDPQQGVLHEVLWSAVEDASLRLSDIASRTSLYAGCAKVVDTDPEARVDDVVNADPTFVASRFAYLHDLWGEALLLDTACSTGLYAVHLACRSLLTGSSDYALAGAVSLDPASDGSYRYRPGFLYADDGVCRPSTGARRAPWAASAPERYCCAGSPTPNATGIPCTRSSGAAPSTTTAGPGSVTRHPASRASPGSSATPSRTPASADAMSASSRPTAPAPASATPSRRPPWPTRSARRARRRGGLREGIRGALQHRRRPRRTDQGRARRAPRPPARHTQRGRAHRGTDRRRNPPVPAGRGAPMDRGHRPPPYRRCQFLRCGRHQRPRGRPGTPCRPPATVPVPQLERV